MLRWLIPVLGTGVLVWAVVLAFQGHFAVAFAIGVFAGCCFQLDRAATAVKQATVGLARPAMHQPVHHEQHSDNENDLRSWRFDAHLASEAERSKQEARDGVAVL